jgi:hypothetical protein
VNTRRHWRTGRWSSLLGVVLVLTGCSSPAQAKTLYVDGSRGDDSVSYTENGPSRPWKTIGRAAWGSVERTAPVAAQAAKAGDVVRIAAGVYSTAGSNQRFEPAYQPANSGEPGKPIRFEGVHEVRLVYSGGRGPMIGAAQRNHIEWAGFVIDEATAPTTSDTGPVTFLAATGGSVEHCVLTGNPSWAEREGDNYPGIRLEDASGIRIYSNEISDYGGRTSGAGDENHGGIETYRSFPVTIEHNRIVNAGAGIYMKAVHPTTLATGSVVIRFNVFENNRSAIRVLRMPMTAQNPMLIYQNLFHKGNDYGVWVNFFDDGPTDPQYIRIFNNTFLDHTGAAVAAYHNRAFKAGTQVLFWNNVIAGGAHAIRMDGTDMRTNTAKDRFDFEHNLYVGTKSGFALLGRDEASLSDWKRRFRQDAASPEATNRRELFANEAERDFRLRASSPGRGLGRAVHGVGGVDGTSIPAGAYITGDEQLGPRARVGVPPPGLPSAPRPQ